jgi:ribosomal protein L37E
MNMNFTHTDTYDHRGMHIEHTTICLCNDCTHTIMVDYEKETLYCSDCGATRKMLTYHHMLTEAENIESWLLKPGL